MRGDGNDRTFLYVIGGIAAVFLIGMLISLLGSANVPADEPTTLAQDSSTVPSTTITAATSADPHLGRPVFDEFLILSLLDRDTAEFCRENFGKDTVACYDAYEQGTDNFEDVIVRNFETRTDTIPSFSPEQYGCHPDGRCLDDYGVWCDDSDFESFAYQSGKTVDLCHLDF